MTSSSYAVDIVDLNKQFKRRTVVKHGYTTIKSSFLSVFTGSKPVTGKNYTQVLKDITVRIPKGSSVGIIGQNGSGKSTLLKLITGIYKPDSGKISINGRIAALIELGAGFHPDFSGRENLFLGGAMHGVSRREMEDRFDEIVRFAELEEVIDDPVRTYSSGMFMRLGFSLAVHLDPDILIVDEVLAVGDARFVSKCKEKVGELRKSGKTLILVTHDLSAVELWCDEAIWLQGGAIRDRGAPRRVIDHYRQYVEKGEELDLLEEQKDARVASVHAEEERDKSTPQRWGSREIEITGVRLNNQNGESQLLFHSEDSVVIELDYAVREPVKDIVFGIGINRDDGLVIHGSNTDLEEVKLPELQSTGTLQYKIARLSLLDGTYTLDVAVHRKDGYPYDYHQGIVKFAVRWPLRQAGVFVPEHEWKFL